MSLFLVAAGAVLRYAVTFDVSGVSRPAIGLTLILAGSIGVALSLLRGPGARRRTLGGPYEERGL